MNISLQFEFPLCCYNTLLLGRLSTSLWSIALEHCFSSPTNDVGQGSLWLRLYSKSFQWYSISLTIGPVRTLFIRYIVWPKDCEHVTIIPICKPTQNCCHTVGSKWFARCSINIFIHWTKGPKPILSWQCPCAQKPNALPTLIWRNLRSQSPYVNHI